MALNALPFMFPGLPRVRCLFGTAASGTLALNGLAPNSPEEKAVALKAAEAAFRERGLAANKKLEQQDETGFGWDTGFAVTDGVPRYQCDLST